METKLVVHFDEGAALRKIGNTKQWIKVINDNVIPLYQKLLFGSLTDEIFKDILAGAHKLTQDLHADAEDQLGQGIAGRHLRKNIIGEIDGIVGKILEVIADIRKREWNPVSGHGASVLSFISIDAEGKAILTPEAEESIRNEFKIGPVTDKGKKLYKLHVKALDAINAMLEAMDTEELVLLPMEELFHINGFRNEKKTAELIPIGYDEFGN